jgi:Ca-activated chloride channel family protein
MSGDSIHQARAALSALAASLKLGDRFTYSRFGSTPQPVLTPTIATDQGRQQLRAAIQRTEADLGGTAMGAAFDHVFELCFPDATDAPDALQADVLVITDGAVWGVQHILERTLRGGHRIYALGVGSAPAASLLSELAEETGGACEFVTPNEDMVAAIRRLMTRMRSASVVRTSMTVEPTPLWHSPLPRRITDDETVHVHLRLPVRPSVAPLLRIDDEESTQAEITWLTDDLVARIVSARQVGYTADQASAAAIAERYQLVTDHTNLLLVFHRADSEKTDGMPALRQVQPMVAAGAGGFGSVRALSVLRTGTDSVPVMAAAQMAMRPGPSASVWRQARTRVDALALSNMEEIDIPAFLRRQDNVQRRPESASAPSMRFGVVRPAHGAAGPSDVSVLAKLAPREIVRAFNEAVQPGLSFRQVLRTVTERAPDPQAVVVVARAKDHVGSLIKAWACFLMWVHQLNVHEVRLSDAALALVEEQLKQLDIQEREDAMGEFDALAA